MRKMREGHKVARLCFRQIIMSSVMILMMALPTVVSRRSSLFYAARPGNPSAVLINNTVHTGNVFFVMTGGTDSSGAGDTPDNPFATIDFAIGQCTANQGDVIYVMPGHTETISAAAGIAQDVNGVSVIGLGEGASRPLITWSATASTWTISGSSALIKNIVCTSSVNELVVMFSSSASDLTMDAVDVKDPGSSLEIIQFLLTTNASDNLIVRNCRHSVTTVAASAQLWIRLIGCDFPYIHDNVFILTLANDATSATISGDGSVTGFCFQRNVIMQAGGSSQASGILMTDGAVGFSVDNRIYVISAGTVLAINDVGTGGFASETYALDDEDKSGILSPGVDT